MTSTPASRRALATTFAPRSWPSSPALAITTRMLLMASSRPGGLLICISSVTAPVLQLLQRGIAQHQVLDAVLPAEVDLRLGAVVDTFHHHDRAEPELVVRHLVPWRER